MTNEFPIKSHAYICIKCNTYTNNKKDYNKHILTLKHKNRTGLTTIEPVNPIVLKNDHSCKRCNKKYIARNSLWYHEKKCNKHEIKLEIIDENIDENDNTNENDDINSDDELNENVVLPPGSDIKVLTSLVLELVKSNTDLQKQVIDLCKNTNSNNNNTINSHNKTFNLQVFLNEECKDAMNLSEFIKSIVVETGNLLDMGELGYVEGMSKIIIKEMNELAENKRPVHCSDGKRETLYIKEENKWEKEDSENLKLKYAIRDIEKKNMNALMNKWVPEHPNCMDGTSWENDEYMKLVKEVMNGSQENINKVIKRLAKEVMIDKSMKKNRHKMK
jgi:hypothetical protein